MPSILSWRDILPLTSSMLSLIVSIILWVLASSTFNTHEKRPLGSAIQPMSTLSWQLDILYCAEHPAFTKTVVISMSPLRYEDCFFAYSSAIAYIELLSIQSSIKFGVKTICPFSECRSPFICRICKAPILSLRRILAALESCSECAYPSSKAVFI